MALYRASDQLLVAAQTVGIRAVEKIHADLTRAAQCVNRHIAVGLVVERRHRRAAETNRGNFECPEPALLHTSASSILRLDVQYIWPADQSFEFDLVPGR